MVDGPPMPPPYLRPAAVATTNLVRIRLRYPDVDTFVLKFAPNVTRGGVFLASRNIQPVGAAIGFEVQLVTGEVVLAGQGKVTWVKEMNPAEPTRPYGMGVQFVSVTPASRPILARILRGKDANAPAPRGLTGMHATLGAGGGAVTNGKRATPVDTNIDLAAELGIDEATLQLVLDRRWRPIGRADDDLGDLLRSEPPETPTLAQALGELPRLLDPQSNRRRTSGGFRTPDSGPVASGTPDPASGPVPAAAPGADTTGTSGADSGGVPSPVAGERSSGRSAKRRRG